MNPPPTIPEAGATNTAIMMALPADLPTKVVSRTTKQKNIAAHHHHHIQFEDDAAGEKKIAISNAAVLKKQYPPPKNSSSTSTTTTTTTTNTKKQHSTRTNYDDDDSSYDEYDHGVDDDSITTNASCPVASYCCCLLLWCIIISLIIATSVILYKVLKREYDETTTTMDNNDENDDNENDDHQLAANVINIFAKTTMDKFDILARFATTISMTAVFSSKNDPILSNWPFVTIDNFDSERGGRKVRKQTNALYLQLLPIVYPYERPMWEEYSVEQYQQQQQEEQEQQEGEQVTSATTNNGNNNRRILQEEEVQEGNNNTPNQEGKDDIVDFSSGIANRIYTFDIDFYPIPEEGTLGVGFFTPMWQSSPAAIAADNSGVNLANYNALRFQDQQYGIRTSLSDGGQLVHGLFKPSTYVMEKDPENDNDKQQQQQTVLLTPHFGGISELQPSVENGNALHSSFYFPVFDSPLEDNNDETQRRRRPVAVLLAILDWKYFFANIDLPAGRSVLAVLDNPCDGPFTYRLDGPRVDDEVGVAGGSITTTYLGRGNLAAEDEATSDHEASATMYEMVGKRIEDLLGYSFNNDWCEVSLKIYPTTKESFDENVSSVLPLVVAISIPALFVLIVAVVVLYRNCGAGARRHPSDYDDDKEEGTATRSGKKGSNKRGMRSNKEPHFLDYDEEDSEGSLGLSQAVGTVATARSTVYSIQEL